MKCLNEDLPWAELLYCDSSSPSGLRWKIDLKRGFGEGYVFKAKGGVAGSLDKEEGYWEIFYRYKTYKAHRIVWMISNGEIEGDLQIDHIDGNRANNDIENLRLVDKAQNARNQCFRVTNTSGKMGVSIKKQDNYMGWVAHWMANGVQKSKTFSIKKYGYDQAYQMAVYAREVAILMLNKQGANYTDRHGLEERLDKTQANSYDECVAILASAKGLQ